MPAKRAGLCLLLLLFSGSRHAAAWVSPAPDVVLYCTPALQAPLRAIAARFTASRHVEVHIFLGPPDGLIGLIRHRARADVVVADTPTLAALAADHLVRPETRVTLGRNPFVLIASTAAALPPGATAAQLLATHPTAVPDPTTAASFDGAAILHAALPDAAPSHIVGVADTPTILALVHADPHLLGLVHATEAGGAGLARAAALPGESTPTAGALVTNGQSGDAAALLAFIAGPIGIGELHNAGLAPLS